MKASFEPILQGCLATYDLDGIMDRYWEYVNLMTNARGELLPLGDFSHMGERQKEFIDALIDMRLEDFAQKVCCKVSESIKFAVQYLTARSIRPTLRHYTATKRLSVSAIHPWG